jgi:hypothetical protein
MVEIAATLAVAFLCWITKSGCSLTCAVLALFCSGVLVYSVPNREAASPQELESTFDAHIRTIAEIPALVIEILFPQGQKRISSYARTSMMRPSLATT